MRPARLVCLAIASGWLLAGCNRLESPTEPKTVIAPPSTLSGTVYVLDADGNNLGPIDGAWVRFRGADRGTDHLGHYDFGRVTAGPGFLQAGGILGFRNVDLPVTILPGPNVVDVELRP